MDTIECITTRMSIRKFKAEPVPKETLLDVIATAKWSPSYKNSQPWEVVVVSGAKKDELSEMLIGLLEKGERPAPDISEPLSWPPNIGKRIDEQMKKKSERLGIDLSKPEYLRKAKIANFRFYGAPHVIFLFQDMSLGKWSILDAGMFAQNLMLAAHARGIGTVPQAIVIDYSKQIKSFLHIAETKRVVLGISIGYPDLSGKANSYKSSRIDTTEMLEWVI
ncbi:nitroreductase [Thermodesulfovibrionales bacterium]|nr:nitroreductase [Thermodesulfovibrionales bacterium]